MAVGRALTAAASAATTALQSTRDRTTTGGAMLTLKKLVALGAIGMFAAPAGAAQPHDTRTPRSIEAVTAIVEAFRTHPVVALAEEHGDVRCHEFRLALIRDPRLPTYVNDIVVEFGNSLHQDVIDRFVDGESVPDDRLKRVWQDTTQAHAIWDRPIYEEFFRTVRAINAPLPRERRVRVLLGDPPVDWNSIRSAIRL